MIDFLKAELIQDFYWVGVQSTTFIGLYVMGRDSIIIVVLTEPSPH